MVAESGVVVLRHCWRCGLSTCQCISSTCQLSPHATQADPILLSSAPLQPQAHFAISPSNESHDDLTDVIVKTSASAAVALAESSEHGSHNGAILSHLSV